jgi:hypothetical protein
MAVSTAATPIFSLIVLSPGGLRIARLAVPERNASAAAAEHYAAALRPAGFT